MKKLHLFAAFAILTVASACHRRHHVTIVTDTNGGYVKLEYSGDSYLTDNAAGIKNIPPGGYLKYETNNEKILAERNYDGTLSYEVNGGDKKLSLNDEEKGLIAIALKAVARHPHHDY